MQIISHPLLNAGGGPGARSQASGGSAKDVTFESALAVMRGAVSDDRATAEPDADSQMESEEAGNGTADSLAESGDVDDAVALEGEATEAATPKVDQELSAGQFATAVSDRVGGASDAVENGTEGRAVAGHSDDASEAVEDKPHDSRADLAPSQNVIGADDVATQAAQARAARTETRSIPGPFDPQVKALPVGQPEAGRWPGQALGLDPRTGAALQSATRDEIRATAAEAQSLHSARQPHGDGLFNVIMPASGGDVKIAEAGLPGGAHTTELNPEPRKIALSEIGSGIEPAAKVTVRGEAAQARDQLANPLAGGPAGMALMTPAIETTFADSLLSAEASAELNAPRPAGAAGLATPAALDGLAARPEAARNAAAHAVEILAREPGKTVEIRLNPEELGRVRMALSPSDAGVTVLITSERPETLELMRRHIEQLSLEFQKLGYEQMSFEFASEGSSGDDQFAEGSPARTDSADIAAEEQNSKPTRLIQTGLDLRL